MVFVGWQQAQIHNLRATIPKAPESKLKAGTKLPDLSGKLLGGGGQKIDLSGPVTLYIFSPKCEWCTKNLDNVQALYQAKGQFVGISVIGGLELEEYAKAHDIKYPVYSQVDGLPIYMTPTTLFVNGGVIKQAWEGSWTNAHKETIERFFGLVLPGLRK